MNPRVHKTNQKNAISMVYAIYNHLNHSLYVGKAISGFDRWKQHYWDSKIRKKGKKSKVELINDWKEFGYHCFGFHVIKQKQTKCYIDQLEAFLIRRWNPSYNVQLIDITKGQSINSFHDFVKDRDMAIYQFENTYLPDVLLNHLSDGGIRTLVEIWDWMELYNLYCIDGLVDDRKRKLFNALVSKGYASKINDKWIVKIEPQTK